MTERLYYTDSYLTRFSAGVVERADQGRRIYLDRTAFYPTSGGQPHDLGRLGGIPVVDVVDEDQRIAHLLAQPLEAETAEGEVDWGRRFDHMQQHTGQHLLSAVFAELFGWPTVSVHFAPAGSTLDLEVGAIAAEDVERAVERANALVTENRSVSLSFEEAATATGLRKASDRAGPLRIVSIQNLDRSACGGTHVRATGEIGAIVIPRVERIRQQSRVEFLCGMRAIRRAQGDLSLLGRLGTQLSATAEDLPASVERLRGDIKECVSARRDLEGQVGRYRARELYDAAIPDSAGVRRITQTATTADALRSLAQGLTQLPRTVLVGQVPEPPTLMVAASPDSGVDAGTALKLVLARVGGRGGGSPRLAQGTVPDAEALARAVTLLMPSAQG